VIAIPQIQQAQRLFGTPDYLFRVLSRDLAAFQKLYDDELARLPGVRKLSSTLITKRLADNRPLQL
jgi:DNA-binding Lrp family transcriptional regulator